MAKTLSINTADIFGSTLQKFPEYIEPDFNFDFDIMAPVDAPIPHRGLEALKQSPGRHPSPQPTNLSYKNGNGNGHRVLRSTTIGYEAPEFKGKQAQMLQGQSYLRAPSPRQGWRLSVAFVALESGTRARVYLVLFQPCCTRKPCSQLPGNNWKTTNSS
jgi:hypothetical protein